MSITAWATPTAGDDAADAPVRTRFVGVLDARARHLSEAGYDPALHAPHENRPHDHCGVCSPRLYSTACPNLLTHGIGVTGWTLAGGASQSTSTGISFDGGSQSASRRILNGDSSWSVAPIASRTVFGAGCPLTLALVARAVGTVTTATLTFGLADASSFATGTRGAIGAGDLTASFERFYVFLTSFSASAHVTDCRVRLETAASWTGTGSIEASLVYLRPGNGLSYWQPGYMEKQHVKWKNVQSGPASIYDQTRDFIDATGLTPT